MSNRKNKPDHKGGDCRSLPRGTVLVLLLVAALLVGLVGLVGYRQGYTLELVLAVAFVVSSVLGAVAVFINRLTHCHCQTR